MSERVVVEDVGLGLLVFLPGVVLGAAIASIFWLVVL